MNPQSTGRSQKQKPPMPGSTPVRAMPSQRLTKYRQADIWASTEGKKQKQRTSFSTAYLRGEIPFHINHGSIQNTLLWKNNQADVNYDPLFLQCVDGFGEVQHPYVFLAREGFKTLLQLPGARAAIVPLLPRVVPCLRHLLMSKNKDQVQCTLSALAQLILLLSSDFVPFKSKFRVVLQRHATTRGPLQSRAQKCTQLLAEIE